MSYPFQNDKKIRLAFLCILKETRTCVKMKRQKKKKEKKE